MMVLRHLSDWKNTDDEDLCEYEIFACSGDTLEKTIIGNLVLLVRHLWHESHDPNYFYAGSKICRHAIIFRDEKISALRKEIRQLKGETK